MQKIKSFIKTPKGKTITTILLILIIISSIAFSGIYLLHPGKDNEKSTIENENEVVEEITQIAGSLAIIEGEVKYSEGTSAGVLTEWKTAEEGLKIEEGLSIKTETDSKAVIELDDGSAVRLNSDSEIIFTTLNSEEIVIDQLSGESYHRVEKDESREYLVTSTSNNEDFQVTALGTAFNISINEDINVKCLESKVNVKYAENNLVELVTEGNELQLKEMTQAEVKGIDAESLDNDWYEFNKNQDKQINAQLGVFEDEDAPNLEIQEPTNNSETTEEKVTIKGVTDENALLKIKVGDNWEIIETEKGVFEKEVSLSIGENKFEVKAYNPAGVKTEQILNIKRKQIVTTQNTTATTETKTFQITNFNSPEAGKISVNWEMSGYDEKSGFKVVFSKNANPEYPNRSGDYYYYTSNGSARTATFTHEQLKSGGTFHIRVCRYESGQCDIYTEDKTVNVTKVEEVVEEWNDPELSLTKVSETEDTVTLSWSVVEGANTSEGFKVVWSTSPNPTYPQNQTSNIIEKENKTFWSKVIEIISPKPAYAIVQLKNWGYKYLNTSDIRNTTITISKNEYETGTYYIRVGRYRGGYCDYYSNEISFELEVE